MSKKRIAPWVKADGGRKTPEEAAADIKAAASSMEMEEASELLQQFKATATPTEREALAAIFEREERDSIEALRTIRDRTLYKDGIAGHPQYESFDVYMTQYWGKTRHWANHQTNWLRVIELLKAAGAADDCYRLSRGAARALLPLSQSDDDRAAGCFYRAFIEASGADATIEKAKAAVAKQRRFMGQTAVKDYEVWVKGEAKEAQEAADEAMESVEEADASSQRAQAPERIMASPPSAELMDAPTAVKNVELDTGE